jgi:hypothetical protein
MSKTVSGEKTRTALALFQTRSSASQLNQLSAAGPGETDRPRANPASGTGRGSSSRVRRSNESAGYRRSSWDASIPRRQDRVSTYS